MKTNHVTIIPSRGRAEYFLKYNDLPVTRFGAPVFNTMLWVRADEAEAYERSLIQMGLSHIPIIIDAMSNNISETRQRILEYAHDNGYEYLWQPDDDIRIYDRTTNFKPLDIRTAKSLDVFYHLKELCSVGFPMVAIRERFMIHTCKYAYEKFHKILCNYFIHVPTFIENGISFKYKDLSVYEDRVVQLLLGKAGYRTLTTSLYAQSQRHEQNDTGGCSAYRTVEENMRCARVINADFPEYTSLHETKTWSKIEATFFLKRFLDEGELPYVPIEKMGEMISKKREEDNAGI